MAREKRTFTAAEREVFAQQQREKLDALGQQLADGVAAIQRSADFQRYLTVATRFHHYSWRNVLLILLQRPDAMRVAGYRTWQMLGRQVRKGETGIRIFAPAPIKTTIKNPATGEEEAGIIPLFKPATVFDIAQTDGDPLPDLEVPTLTGEGDAAAYGALVAFAEAEGLTVTSHDPNTDGDDTRSSYQGYLDPAARCIFVKRPAGAHMLKTLIHELGHYLDPKLREADRSEQETVAEAVAFMVTAGCGLDSGGYSFGYIATWAGREDGVAILTRVMERTQVIATRLLDAIMATGEPSRRQDAVSEMAA